MIGSRYGAAIVTALLAAACAAAGAWLSGLVAVRQATGLDELRHGRAVMQCGEIVDDMAARLESIAAKIATRADEPASALAQELLVERVTVLDAHGDVVSSSVWPERVGLAAPELAALKGGPAQAVQVRTPDGSRLEMLARHGAVIVGTVFGDELHGVMPGSRCLIGDSSTVGGTAGDGRNRAWVPIPGGRALVVVSEPRSVPEARRRLRERTAMVGLGGGAIGLVVGSWLARRVRRPFDRLVGAVRAIAEGRADYGFAATDRDAVDETARIVSALERALERQRRRSAAAERIAAWREVARHVSHEVKNPLVPIRLTVDNLRRAKQGDAGRFDELFDQGARTILEEVDQLQRLVGEFSEFARLPAPELGPIDLVTLVSEVADLYATEPGLEIDRRFETGLPRVSGDADQLSRVLKNVVGNAIEAMREADGHSLTVGLSRSDGGVRIEIEDSGPGLPEGGERRLFEAGFTTKTFGSGLGMAIVERIVSEHGGSVQAENRADSRGARVAIELPVAEEPV